MGKRTRRRRNKRLRKVDKLGKKIGKRAGQASMLASITPGFEEFSLPLHAASLALGPGRRGIRRLITSIGKKRAHKRRRKRRKR